MIIYGLPADYLALNMLLAICCRDANWGDAGGGLAVISRTHINECKAKVPLTSTSRNGMDCFHRISSELEIKIRWYKINILWYVRLGTCQGIHPAAVQTHALARSHFFPLDLLHFDLTFWQKETISSNVWWRSWISPSNRSVWGASCWFWFATPTIAVWCSLCSICWWLRITLKKKTAHFLTFLPKFLWSGKTVSLPFKLKSQCSIGCHDDSRKGIETFTFFRHRSSPLTFTHLQAMQGHKLVARFEGRSETIKVPKKVAEELCLAAGRCLPVADTSVNQLTGEWTMKDYESRLDACDMEHEGFSIPSLFSGKCSVVVPFRTCKRFKKLKICANVGLD